MGTCTVLLMVVMVVLMVQFALFAHSEVPYRSTRDVVPLSVRCCIPVSN